MRKYFWLVPFLVPWLSFWLILVKIGDINTLPLLAFLLLLSLILAIKSPEGAGKYFAILSAVTGIVIFVLIILLLYIIGSFMQ